MFGALGQAARENNKRRAAIYKSPYRVCDPMGMVVSDLPTYLQYLMKMFLMYCIY